MVDTVQAKLSRAQLARRAQRVLYDAQYYSPRDLEEMLLSRLRLEYNDHQGIGLTDEELRDALNDVMFDFSNGEGVDCCGMARRAKLRGTNHLNRAERPPCRWKTLSSPCFAG